MSALFELGPGWFLLAWWGIAIVVLVGVGVLAARLRLPGHPAATGEDDPVSGYDLAYLHPILPMPGLVALASLRQRGILRIDEAGKLQRGDVALPADAPAIEVQLAEQANGTPAGEAAVAAAEHAHDLHLRRNRDRGLVMIPEVERAARFVVGCGLALVMAAAALRLWWTGALLGSTGIPSTLGLLASMAVVGWIGIRVLRRPWMSTRRFDRACARVARAHDRPQSWRGWPAADLSAEQVELALALWGPAIALGGGARREWAAYVDRAPEPEEATDPEAAAFRVDSKLVREAFGAGRAGELEDLSRRARLTVLASGAFTIGIVLWLGVTAGPPASSGSRQAVEPPERPKVVAPGEHGFARALEPMPAAVRGRRPPGCDPAVAKRGEESVFAILAQREHAMDLDEAAVDPEVEAAKLREHIGDPNVAYAATGDGLYRIDVEPDGRARAIEVGPLKVKVGVTGPQRTFEPHAYYSAALRGLAFDARGLLWGVGDERLYMCSIGTGICAPQGIVPVGTRALAVDAERAKKGQVLAIERGTETSWVQRAGLPGALAEFGDAFLHTIELCTESGPRLHTDAEIVTPPADAGDGAFVVVLKRQGALALSRLRFGAESPLASVAGEVPLRLDEPPVALATVPAGVLAFHGGGAIVLVDPTDGRVRARSETGLDFRAAASRVLPDPTPAEREE